MRGHCGVALQRACVTLCYMVTFQSRPGVGCGITFLKESEDDSSQLVCLDILKVEFCSLGPGIVLVV